MIHGSSEKFKYQTKHSHLGEDVWTDGREKGAMRFTNHEKHKSSDIISGYFRRRIGMYSIGLCACDNG